MYGFGDTGQKKRTLQDGDRQGILWIYEHAPFDGAPPSTAVEPASVRSGETVTLRLRVDDPAPSCGWAMVRVRIRDADGKWVRSSSVIERRTNEWATYSFRCRLAAGSYAVHVFARDLALHEQTKVGTAALTVE
jgi:FtsP/CotA-like multicopper oxidase with cupredoxin domain